VRALREFADEKEMFEIGHDLTPSLLVGADPC